MRPQVRNIDHLTRMNDDLSFRLYHKVITLGLPDGLIRGFNEDLRGSRSCTARIIYRLGTQLAWDEQVNSCDGKQPRNHHGIILSEQIIQQSSVTK